ncbi:caspase, EACC1-associated type [Saccharopolyspora shandongensis]|uniref:caspase, EACC1-associated type n=1 Tax=Saccharopolyspora shandongensis TaxID=418495 RepID=UPI0015A54BC0|nr:AAA family ATPase [Saccharopolyspora shandongensis]
MSPLTLGLPGTRVLVAGTGKHVSTSPLPDVPAVPGTVRDLAQVLTDRCGLAEGNLLRPLIDPTPSALESALIDAASQATDALLFYYVGHGLVSAGNELYLATRDTDHFARALATKALPFSAVRDALTDSRAQAVVVILDCCFSGRARGSFGTPVADALELATMGGTYLLASAAPETRALAPEGRKHTAFSGELITFLRDGDPTMPALLTAEDAYRHLSRTLPRHGFPQPHRQLSGRTGELVLATNPAAPTVTAPRPPGRTEENPRTDQPCPYLGLDAFSTADVRYFFGRGELTATLMRHLAARAQDTSLAAVVGPSGAGKSSLLHAGLLPAVKQGRLPIHGSRTWPSSVLTPGEHPLDTLAARFAQLAGTSREALRAELAANPMTFAQIVRDAGRTRADGTEVPDGRILLVVDQFEEVFACPDEDERRAFIQALCAAAQSGEGGTPAPALVVLGIRADAYSRCLAYPELLPALEDGQLLVKPMSEQELRETIEKPAEVAGLPLEDGLAELLLQDLRSGQDVAQDTGGTLPLLSFALLGTWQRREPHTGTLTLAGYRATGGIWKAVTQQADATFDELGDAEQRAARTLLLRMVRLSEGVDDGRRPVNVTDLLRERPGHETEAMRHALDAFVQARLVTVDQDTAQITHEALLRTWPRLRNWIDEDRSGLLVHQRLAEAADAWQRENRDRTTLYRGSRLAAARQWVGDHEPRAGLTALERDFLRASTRAGLLSRLLVIGVVGALLLAGVVAVQQSWINAERDEEAASVQLATQADAIRTSDPAAALQLSLAAYRTAKTPEARAAIHAAVTTPYPISLPGHTGDVLNVAYSSNGRVLASSATDHTVRLWDVSDVRHPAGGAVLPTPGTAAIAFSPDGRLLAGHSRRTLFVWDVTDPRHPVEKARVESATDLAMTVAFSPDGRMLAAGSDEGRLRLWDLSDISRPTPQHTLFVDTEDVTSVAFRPDGATLAAASTGGTVRLWNLAEAQPSVISTLPAESASAVVFSPEGRWLIAGGVFGRMESWDVTDPRNPVSKSLGLHSTGDWISAGDLTSTLGPKWDKGDVLSIAFSPNGEHFAASSSSGTVQRYEFTDTGLTDPLMTSLNSFRSGSPARAVAFSPDNHQIVAGRDRGVVQIWTTPSAPPLPTRLSTYQFTGTPGSVFGGGGNVLIGFHEDGAQLWDITDRRRPTVAAVLPQPWQSGGFLSDGRTLIAFAGDRSSVALWDVGDPRHPVIRSTIAKPGPETGNLRVAVGLENHVLAMHNDADDAIHLFDIAAPDRPVEAARVASASGVKGFDLSSGGRRLVVFDDLYRIRLWDLTDLRLPIGGDAVGSDDPDDGDFDTTGFKQSFVSNDRLYGLVPDREVTLWQLTGSGNAERRGELPPASAMSVSREGAVVITASTMSRTIELWDVGDLGHPSVLSSIPIEDEDESVSSTLTSDDDRFLAVAMRTDRSSSFFGRTVRLWDVADPAAVAEHFTIPAETIALEFGPDDHTLAVDTDNPEIGQGVVLLELDSDRLYEDLCSYNVPAMNAEQWARHVPNRPYRSACA